MSDRAVLGQVATELAAVQRDSQSGWSPALVSRALAALRVAAAYARGPSREPRPLAAGAVAPEATAHGVERLAAAAAIRRRRPHDGGRHGEGASEAAARPRPIERRELLEALQTALTMFTAAAYAQDGGGR